MTDAEIRSACAPYCTGGFDDSDLDDFLDRGAGEVERARRGLGRAAGAADVGSNTNSNARRRPKSLACGCRCSTIWSDRCARTRQKEDVVDQITALNADYALVLAGNKAAVMKFKDATRFRLLQVGAFKQWFSNQLVTVGKDVISLGEYWLGHVGAAAICRHRIRAAGHRRHLGPL